MKEIIKILESHPLFRAVSKRALEDLTTKAKLCRYAQGDTIYSAGSQSEFLYLVLEGLCEAIPQNEDAEHITYGMGAIFGEYGAQHNKRRQSTIKVIADALVLQIQGENLRTFITENENLTTLFEGKKHNKFLHFDSSEKSFKPCEKNIITFVDFTQNACLKEFLPRICRVLNKETSRSVLLIELSPDTGEIEMSELGQHISQFNGKSKIESKGNEFSFLNLKIKLGNDERSYPYLRPFLDYASREFPYIIAHVPGSHLSQTVETCINQSNTIYLSLSESGSDTYAANNFLKSNPTKEVPNIKPILISNEISIRDQHSKIGHQIGMPIHAVIKQTPEAIFIPKIEDWEFERTKRFEAQFRRIAREIGHCRIGLALSSGGAKGLSHVGVIQVLEENNIEIDYIAGTSIGSYVSACWARGYNSKAMRKLALDYQRPLGLWNLIDPLIPPRTGVIKGDKVEKRLNEILMNAYFEDLSMPLGVVATNLRTLEATTFTSGNVSSAVRASCTIPGICKPAKRNDELYVDGGITNPLPIDVLEKLGIENIIAVSTVPSPDDYREFYNEREMNYHKDTRIPARIFRFLNEHLNYFAKGNVFDTIMRSIEAAQIRIVERELFRTDVAIQPISCSAQWHDFQHPEIHIERGRQAAEEQLELIKSLTYPKAS